MAAHISPCYSNTVAQSTWQTVCTDHIDFPMLFAELQVFGCTDFTYKTVLVLNSSSTVTYKTKQSIAS